VAALKTFPKWWRRARSAWRGILATFLLLILTHTVWDYVEARRLQSALARWEDVAKRRSAEAETPSGRNAAPYYLAAQMLMTSQSAGITALHGRLQQELSAGSVKPDTLPIVGAFVQENDEVLRLLDRATDLEFTGFPIDREPVFNAERARQLTSLRTVHLALTGAGDAAAHASVASLRIDSRTRRPMSRYTALA
jgi:hypothetical protein